MEEKVKGAALSFSVLTAILSGCSNTKLRITSDPKGAPIRITWSPESEGAEAEETVADGKDFDFGLYLLAGGRGFKLEATHEGRQPDRVLIWSWDLETGFGGLRAELTDKTDRQFKDGIVCYYADRGHLTEVRLIWER